MSRRASSTSRSVHQVIEVGNLQVDGHPDRQAPLTNQPPQGESNFGDSSGPLLSIYSKYAEEEDNKVADRWQKDADGILIFTGLFSAAVAALLAVSVQDLRPNSQDTSAFYLQNIYLILADPNVTVLRTSIPSPVAKPPLFSPPRYAIWVNSLWVLSLVISLTCALLATSLHQWARRYVRVTQPARCSPEKRARMRAFFSGGMDKMHLPWVVEALPALLHLSLFLFLSGLIIFLLNVNHNVFLSVVWWFGSFSAMYVCITFMPIFRKDSPYYTPLSTPVAIIPVSILNLTRGIVKVVPFYCFCIVMAFYATIHYCLTCSWIIICSFTRLRGRHSVGDAYLDDSIRTRLVHHGTKTWNRFIQCLYDMKTHIYCSYIYQCFDSLYRSYEMWNRQNAAEATTLRQSSELDLGILRWTVGALGEDDALEKFFDALPGFFNSELVKVPKVEPRTHDSLYYELQDASRGFLHRTLSSNSVTESVKNRRLDIYSNATNVIFGPHQVPEDLYFILRVTSGQSLRTIEMANVLARWCTSNNGHIALAARCLVAGILQATQQRDNCWIALARGQLGLPDHILRENITRGDDSVLLAIFIHMTREIIHTETETWNSEATSSLSRFDIHNASIPLQNEFCALWNQIILKARDERNHSGIIEVLSTIDHLYIALHQGAEAGPTAYDAPTAYDDLMPYYPSWYPLCNIAAHHPNLTAPPPTRLDDLNVTFPHSSLLEIQPIPGGNKALQKALKANIVLGHPSSSDYASPHPQGFPSPPSTTDPIPITPQITSVTDPSIHESIHPVTPDVNGPVLMEIAHLTPQSSLPTVDVTTNTVWPDGPTPDILINEIREFSQTHRSALLTAPHPSPHPVLDILSSVPRLHSVSVQQPDRNKQQDITAPSDASDILSTANQISWSIPSIDVTQQTSDGSTDVRRTIVSGPQTAAIMTPALHSIVVPVGPLSSESALFQPDHVSHPIGSVSSFDATENSHIALHITSVLDSDVTTSTGSGTPNMHDNTIDLTHSIPMEASRHGNELEPSTSDIADHTLPPKGQDYD